MKMNFKDDGGRTILCIDFVGKEDNEGWLQAIVDFNDNGFSAHFQISLMLNELYTFHGQLDSFTKNLEGQPVFSTTEDNVNLIFSTSGLGHIKIEGKLTHADVPDLELLFAIQSDQTFLSELLWECNQIITHYQDNKTV